MRRRTAQRRAHDERGRQAPSDRASALESAFTKVFADKELLVDADKGKLEIDPTIGEEIHKLVVEFIGMTPELRGKSQTALKGEL